MFMATLHAQYMERMPRKDMFIEVVSVGEQIERQMKKGKIPCDTNASNGEKKTILKLP